MDPRVGQSRIVVHGPPPRRVLRLRYPFASRGVVETYHVSVLTWRILTLTYDALYRENGHVGRGFRVYFSVSPFRDLPLSFWFYLSMNHLALGQAQEMN